MLLFALSRYVNMTPIRLVFCIRLLGIGDLNETMEGTLDRAG